jgi:hypothetical protein
VRVLVDLLCGRDRQSLGRGMLVERVADKFVGVVVG